MVKPVHIPGDLSLHTSTGEGEGGSDGNFAAAEHCGDPLALEEGLPLLPAYLCVFTFQALFSCLLHHCYNLLFLIRSSYVISRHYTREVYELLLLTNPIQKH